MIAGEAFYWTFFDFSWGLKMDEDIRTDLLLFEEKGEQNTSKCFDLVKDRMEERAVEKVVVASTSGENGVRALRKFEDLEVKIVVVSHQFGYKKDGKIEFDDQKRKKIERADNASLVVTSDLLTRVPKMFRGKYGGSTKLDIIADTLRIFSEGVKVCVECSVQATDSGEISPGEEVAVIAGTAHGADTAVILESAHSHKLFEFDIKEIICIPRDR